MQLEYITRYNIPNTTPEKIIILLHGLGATCEDLLPIINSLNLNKPIKFIFPNAPVINITANANYQMRAWYDILSYNNFVNRARFEDVVKNIDLIHQIIDKEVENGFNEKDIILGGFSQGGLMSYYAGLSYKNNLGGVIALSCYTIPNKHIYLTSDNCETKIFAAHGTLDDLIPYNIGKESYQSLKDKGFDIMWHEYNIGHSICHEEIHNISDWINLLFNTK